MLKVDNRSIIIDNYAAFFNCTPVGRSGARLCGGTDLIKLFILVGWGRSFLSVAWHTGVQLMFFSFVPDFSNLFGAQGSPSSDSLVNLCVLVFD